MDRLRRDSRVDREIQGNIAVSDDLFFAALYTTSEEGEFSDVLEWWAMSAEFAFNHRNIAIIKPLLQRIQCHSHNLKRQ
jgi:hypothetical protein